MEESPTLFKVVPTSSQIPWEKKASKNGKRISKKKRKKNPKGIVFCIVIAMPPLKKKKQEK